MRIVVFGLGAVGGVIAAALVDAGTDVIAIARGPMLDALKRGPLRLRHPGGVIDASMPVVAHAGDIEFRADDLILLTMKSQDTVQALSDLRLAGVTHQPIFCFQNGVSNEDMALRRFPNVHGVTVMMPASYVTPGEVVGHGAPKLGLFDIGRYPTGLDDADRDLTACLNAAGMRGFPTPDVMASKRGKLVLNVANAIEAALGPGADRGKLGKLARDEATAVFEAAGLAWTDVGGTDPRRRELMQITEVDGVGRTGGSTSQSLLRGTGVVETDWLNGEVVRLGRLHGVETPANAFLSSLSARLAAARTPPGSLTEADLHRRFTAWCSRGL